MNRPQTRSQTRTSTAREESNLQNVEANPDLPEEGSFEPSFVDVEKANDHDCKLCDRPNGAEAYMVQCVDCKRWDHFSCAGVTTSSVKLIVYRCVMCAPRIPTQPPSSVTAQSTTSSARRARLKRDLERLEEEKKLQEDAAKDKLERDQIYLDKKYELLLQHDDDEEQKSICSHRSDRSNSRTADWIKAQAVATVSTGPAIVRQTSFTNVPNQTQSDKRLTRLDKHMTSTPLTTLAEIGGVSREAPSDCFVKPSTAKTVDSCSIGNLPDGVSEISTEISGNPFPRVNIQPLVDMLKEPPSLTKYTGTIPKSVKPSFDQWHRETAGLRKIRELQNDHEKENDIRRKREMELAEKLKNLDQQRLADAEKMRKIEADLRQQVREFREQYEVASKQQRAELQERDDELTYLRQAEKLLRMQLQAAIQGSTNATESVIGISPVTGNIPPPPSAMSPVSTPNMYPHVTYIKPDNMNNGYFEALSTPVGARSLNENVDQTPPIPPYVFTNISPQLQPPCTQSRQPEFQNSASSNVIQLINPSPAQLAARNVSKDLPVFDGDPLHWPLFICSYQHSTAVCGFSDSENLLRLQRSLKGSAKEAVNSFLLHPSTVSNVISTLTTLYGRPEQIIHNMINKIRSLPTPKADREDTLITFGLAVQNLCGHLKATGMEMHFGNPELLQELVGKLPFHVKLNWALYQQQFPSVDLHIFGKYMEIITTATSQVTLSSGPSGKTNREERPKTNRAFVNTHAAVEESEGDEPEERFVGSHATSKMCVNCKGDCRTLENCSSFLNLSVDDRWSFVKQNKLCRNCLTFHRRWPCRKEACGLNNCKKRHHRMLHFQPDSQEQTVKATVSIHQLSSTSVLYRMLPVTLYGPSGQVETFAFLDDGSSVTLLENAIANELGAEGPITSLCMQWTGGVNKTISGTKKVSLEISAAGSKIRHSLSEVYTVDSLDLPAQSLNYEEMSRTYNHLAGLPISSFKSATPGLLIGLSNVRLLTALKTREGRTGEPVAAKSRIGWSVYGCLPKGAQSIPHRQMHICTNKDDNLHDYVQQFFRLESLGVAVAPEITPSEDLRAQQILEATTKQKADGHFEVGLLWRYDYIEFPDSRPMAEKRLRCLEKRLGKEPDLYDNVRQQIAAYQQKGYVHRATPDEIGNFDIRRTWYLPLGVVINPKKPDKIRLIWDAAAKVDGVSLNSMLMKGPDLLSSLLSILLRYRERQVAISGDIREMFHQMSVREEDRCAQLFLWRNSPDQEIQTMVSDVAIFGATCSPAHSQYVKNLNAAKYAKHYPEAADVVINSHYVDDCLKSVDTDEQAIELAQQVSEIHANGGFKIVNWMSSSKTVLNKLGETDPSTIKTLRFNTETGTNADERLLGMTWHPDEDVFKFTLTFQKDIAEIINGNIIPTKRQLLRLVMSIFDPLGIVSNFIIHGKIIIQDLWRVKTGWDEEIPPKVYSRFKLWATSLKDIEKVRVHRCYFPGYQVDSYQSLQLHIFVDASEEAYAAVAYFRIVDYSYVRCALVSSKTKVAPLQLLSIPRLELLAAVIGVRLRKTIEAGMSLKINKTYFWSDSTTVLSWIRSDLRRYRPYVGHRISEILDSSNVEEWRWVPTRLNVADDATKWGKGPAFDSRNRWYNAPEFLYDEEEEWPKDCSIPETNEEIKPTWINTHILNEPEIDATRFSKWERLLRTMAYVFLFIGPRPLAQKIITSENLRNAETTLWKIAQAEFSDEVAVLIHNQNATEGNKRKLPTSSQLARYDAFLDTAGVLRINGRTEAADWLSYDSKFPIILPKNHRITMLLLDWYHRRHQHANHETVVNEVRQKFQIPRLRIQVQLAIKNCMWCRVYKSIPAAPKMGPLPKVRITPYVRPFTYTGIDYFGPYLVKVKRSAEKRWVVLFTCLTVRAVHLEVASSLTSDSCKKAIRRFIARRGAPEEIYTDHGTNFIGVSRELKAELENINEEMCSTFTDTLTQWYFIPPAAPHMGGCWERMVRSIKTALGSIPTMRKLDDESLLTVLAEAEHMVNSRPLTFIPLRTENDESLTPNHFLLLNSKGTNQGVKQCIPKGAAIRGSWDLIQQVLQTFWRRWINEYLPTITRRTKWFEDVRPIKEGELVVVVNEGVRNKWTRGRILKIFPGKDGVARLADLQTKNGILTRPFTKLALLDVGVHDTE
ncbi:uncharacterized protein LOC129760233 [Uranotaenia lowii]|uniref:uncharacterized protein LOC129760233 n=1 Tax=Uranotaenia lowii TaxID=190385 RepID=UPI0024799169|nr:uncharacterized protein LOC129760233 [Uranotaenia lowii]